MQYAVPNADGTYRYIDAATSVTFAIGALSFPPPYLAQASAADLASHGILAVVETPQPTGNFATISSSIEMVAGVPTVVWATTPAPALPPTSVQVNSTSTPAISGTYAFDATTQANVMAIALYIQVNGKFPDGLNPFPWPDASGTMHDFASTSQFLALASALADYATALNLGLTPAAPLTIA